MNYSIKILELERKRMEQAVREGQLMERNKPLAIKYLKHISEIKKAIVFLKAKSTAMKNRKQVEEDVGK